MSDFPLLAADVAAIIRTLDSDALMLAIAATASG
jgi:hypothetical protein